MSTGAEYRGYSIKPKKDFGTQGFLIEGKWVKKGYVVVKDGCNAMPGATWFRTVAEAEEAIDVLIAVDGDAELFWELLQPFGHFPGEKNPSKSAVVADSVVQSGRFLAKIVGGVVSHRTVRPRPITSRQFLGLAALLKSRARFGRVVFGMHLVPPSKITLAAS